MPVSLHTVSKLRGRGWHMQCRGSAEEARVKANHPINLRPLHIRKNSQCLINHISYDYTTPSKLTAKNILKLIPSYFCPCYCPHLARWKERKQLVHPAILLGGRDVNTQINAQGVMSPTGKRGFIFLYDGCPIIPEAFAKWAKLVLLNSHISL